jgi:hypothetical protein
LIDLSDGRIVPAGFAGLERAVTEGVFWTLANAAEAAGLARETFTSPFGTVFERFVQESIERIAGMEVDRPKIFVATSITGLRAS